MLVCGVVVVLLEMAAAITAAGGLVQERYS